MPPTTSAPVRRRPSGEPPPLPREDRWTRWIWVLAAVLVLGVVLNILIGTTDVVQTADRAVLSFIATKVFTPDEIAEACVSAVGLTIPTELQAKMKADGRPLLDRFRQLAPRRDRISIQRWSARRLLLTAGAVLGTLILVGLFIDSLRAGVA